MTEAFFVLIAFPILVGLCFCVKTVKTWFFNTGREEAVYAAYRLAAKYKQLRNAQPAKYAEQSWYATTALRTAVLAEYKLKVARLLWRVEHLDTHRPLDIDPPEPGLDWQGIKEEAMKGEFIIDWLLWGTAPSSLTPPGLV